MLKYKDFFFINNKYFTYNNWIYFYKLFLLKLNIDVIFFFDFKIHYKFINKIENLKIPILNINKIVFFRNVNFLNFYFFKYIFLLNIINIYIIKYNKNIYDNKLIFFKNIKN